MKIKIGIVEDNTDFRLKLEHLLGLTDEFELHFSYESIEQLLDAEKKNNHIDVILLDIDLPGINGVDGVKYLKDIYSDSDILMLTVHEDNDFVFDSLKNGASGYITKISGFKEIEAAIFEIFKGGAPMSANIARLVIDSFRLSKSDLLSEREMDVLRLLEKGLLYKEIAEKLFVHVETVKSHIKNIYKKLNVNNKIEAITKAKKDKLI